jgi:hypothetical protein
MNPDLFIQKARREILPGFFCLIRAVFIRAAKERKRISVTRVSKQIRSLSA